MIFPTISGLISEPLGVFTHAEDDTLLLSRWLMLLMVVWLLVPYLRACVITLLSVALWVTQHTSELRRIVSWVKSRCILFDENRY